MKDLVVSAYTSHQYLQALASVCVCLCVFAYVYMAGMRSESLQVSPN